jgi:hypothetical protein
VADGDWTPEIARDRNVEAVLGAAAAWSRSVALLHDAADANPASDTAPRWNNAVHATGEALDRMCGALASGDTALASKVRASAGDAELVRRFVLQALDEHER